MKEILNDYRYALFIGSAMLFIIALVDFIKHAVRSDKKRSGDLSIKHYSDGKPVYAGSEQGMLSYQLDNVYLIGKPDLVLLNEATGKATVIDFKSGRAPAIMNKSHSLQLAAYFLMVENALSLKVDRGVIRYLDDDNKELSIVNDALIMKELGRRLDDLALSKKDMNAGNVPMISRNHKDRYKCNICEFREQCPEAIK